MPRDKLPLLLVMLQDREPRIVFSFVYCLFYFNFYFVFSLPPPHFIFFFNTGLESDGAASCLLISLFAASLTPSVRPSTGSSGRGLFSVWKLEKGGGYRQESNSSLSLESCSPTGSALKSI